MSSERDQSRRFSLEGVHSVRLFPKKLGREGYRITGIAARCDWQLMTFKNLHFRLHRHEIEHPRVIFVSLRGLFSALRYFHDEVMPLLSLPFVLVTGSEDLTVPNQMDLRWPSFNQSQQTVLEAIRTDPRLIAWFAENLDERRPKMIPLPTGFVMDGDAGALDLVETATQPLAARQQRALCAHRIRKGSQWERRQQVASLCRHEWRAFTTLVEREISLHGFMAQVRDHPFVLCVEGGGLDPSPKAWMSLALGSVPVMRRSATTVAYEEQLPVALVDDWDVEALTPARMNEWCERLSPWFDTEQGRAKLERRLSLQYWWSLIWNSYLQVADPSRIPTDESG